ncbi:mucin-associated surface protein (MASP), putative [Trypanosoma cruzi]|nr:mucin-associated surface protein (MASP), putative [Trypanosoma cruzi]
MAMMMTGRVLLVCALCVLWCGPGGKCAEEKAGHDVQRDVSASGTPLLGSKELVTPRQETQELKVGPTDVNVKVPSAPPPSLEEDDDDDIDSDDSEEKQEKIKGPTQAQEGKNNKGTPESLPPPPPPPPPSAGEESPTAEEESSQNVTTVTNKNTPSGSKMESKAPEPPSGDAAQGQHSHDTDTENSTKNAAAAVQQNQQQPHLPLRVAAVIMSRIMQVRMMLKALKDNTTALKLAIPTLFRHSVRKHQEQRKQ